MADELLLLTRQSYVRLTLRQTWDGLPLVAMGSFVFSLCCLPALSLFILNLPLPAILAGAVSIAPAWAALLALEADILQDKKTGLAALLRALPAYAGRSMKLGLLAAFPLAAGFLTLPLLAAPETPPVVWLGIAADALGLLLLLALFIYTFPLLVLYDLDMGPALRNSLILASRYLAHTLGLLSLGGLFLLAGLYLNSGLLFILPAIWGMFIVNNCRLVVDLEKENSSYEQL